MSAGVVAIAVVPDRRIGTSLWELYEIAIACAVFGNPQPDLADPWYELRLCGEAGPGVFSLRTEYGLDGLVGADTVIVPSVPDAVVDDGEEVPAELVEALRAAASSGARMVSLCTGAFALAAAGLLDGRRATAHWQHTAQLAARHPEVVVDDSVLYTDEGSVLTSAGATAALDLCLHLVRRDLGATVAGQLARRLVVPAHRSGGQAQFIEAPLPPSDDDSLGPVLQWATENLAEPLTVDDLARRARLSPRTFHHAAPGDLWDHSPAVAAPAAGGPCAEPARSHRSARGADRRPQRSGYGGEPAPSLHAVGRGLAHRLPQVVQAFGATFDRPLMMRSIASPPVGSVRLASIFSVNFMSSGWVRPRWVAIFMTFGLPMSFTKARPSV